jgi:hypothetical protein
VRALRVTKTRSSFPNDDALLKLLYLALCNISKRWTGPVQDWKAAVSRSSTKTGCRQIKKKVLPVRMAAIATIPTARRTNYHERSFTQNI